MRLPCVRWQNRVETYSELCHLLPDYDTITVVLIGPRMLDSQHGKEGKATGLRDGDNMKSGTCTIIVQGFKGIYSAEVLERWPASPDIIIGFDVDLYTCSWRPTLLYLLHVSQVRGPKIVFTFFMVHEPVYVLELLAEPLVSFGEELRQDCADEAHSKHWQAEWGAQIDAGAPLLDWSYRQYLPKSPGKETHIFCAILYQKRIILPRQARDKHRESTQKESCVVLQGCRTA